MTSSFSMSSSSGVWVSRSLTPSKRKRIWTEEFCGSGIATEGAWRRGLGMADRASIDKDGPDLLDLEALTLAICLHEALERGLALDLEVHEVAVLR